MTSKVFVTGATGTTGSATVRSLRAAGVEVVAGVRSTEKSGPLEQMGAETRPFQFDDVAGMTAALAGIERLYPVTPVTHEMVKVTSAIVDAAKAAGVRHVVKLSGLDVDKETQFELGRWHRASEKVIEASSLQWTFLRANNFMQNFLGSADTIKGHGAFYNPFGAAAVSYIDARDIGDVAAKVLTTDDHQGKAYSLTGPAAITNADIAAQLSTITGKSITCGDVTMEQTFEAMTGAGMPEREARAVVELLPKTASGGAATVSRSVERLLGRLARDFATFTADFATAFR